MFFESDRRANLAHIEERLATLNQQQVQVPETVHQVYQGQNPENQQVAATQAAERNTTWRTVGLTLGSIATSMMVARTTMNPGSFIAEHKIIDHLTSWPVILGTLALGVFAVGKDVYTSLRASHRNQPES